MIKIVMGQRIFLYGTLKRGLSNSRYMRGQRFIADAHTEPAYRMIDAGGYPGMYRVTDNGLSIQGELWEVDDACRQHLDKLEDVAMGLYVVESVTLLAPYGEELVMTYIYNWSTAGCLDAGDSWRE